MFYRFQASFGYSPYLWAAPSRKSSLVATLREPTSPEAPSPPFQALLTPFSAYSCNILHCEHIHISYLTVWRYSCNILRRKNWQNILLRTFLFGTNTEQPCSFAVSGSVGNLLSVKKRSFYSSTVFWAGFGIYLKDLKWGSWWGWRWWQRWWRWQYDGDDHDDDDDHDYEDDHDDGVVLTCLAEEKSSQSLPSPHSCPKNLQNIFSIEKNNSSHLLVGFVRRQGNVSQKTRFSRSPHKQITCSCSCFDPSPL